MGDTDGPIEDVEAPQAAPTKAAANAATSPPGGFTQIANNKEGFILRSKSGATSAEQKNIGQLWKAAASTAQNNTIRYYVCLPPNGGLTGLSSTDTLRWSATDTTKARTSSTKDPVNVTLGAIQDTDSGVTTRFFIIGPTGMVG